MILLLKQPPASVTANAIIFVHALSEKESRSVLDVNPVLLVLTAKSILMNVPQTRASTKEYVKIKSTATVVTVNTATGERIVKKF